jgi:NitT/TauT family transport system substrate-binding protein
MRIVKSRRSVLRDFAVVALAASGFGMATADAARAGDAVRVLLDRRPDGAAAPFFVAQAKGLFRAQGIDLTVESAGGSQDAIERLGHGDADIAIADLDALIRVRDGALCIGGAQEPRRRNAR